MKPSDDDKLLTMILAQGDAFWLPFRQGDEGGRATIFQARLAFATNGVRGAGGGGAEARRMSHSRRVSALAAAGRVVRRGEGMTLTPAEGARLRGLLGLATFAQALPALDVMTALRADHGRPAPGGPWIPETVLADIEYGTPGNGKILGLLQNHLLPLLTAGLIESNSDVAGRASYALTATGEALARERITSGEADPDAFPPEVGAGDEDLSALYYAERRAGRESLRSATPPDPAEIGEPPLPVSWPASEH